MPVEAHLFKRTASFDDLIGRFHEHPAGTARWIVDGVSGLGFQDQSQKSDDGSRREKLTGLLARLVGKLLEKVFVRVT